MKVESRVPPNTRASPTLFEIPFWSSERRWQPAPPSSGSRVRVLLSGSGGLEDAGSAGRGRNPYLLTPFFSAPAWIQIVFLLQRIGSYLGVSLIWLIRSS
jgi:hypothetical protein